MFDGYWRGAVERRVDPLGATLQRHGVTANVLTSVGVVLAAVTAALIAVGELRPAFVVLLAAGAADLLDGPVANAEGPASRRGAFFDSTADRVTDTLVLAGVVWFFIDDERGLLAMVPVAVMAVSWLISYQRAKAESLGFDAKGGVMERAERVVALSVGLVIPSALTAVLWIMLALTLATAGQRFVKVWRQGTAAMAATKP